MRLKNDINDIQTNLADAKEQAAIIRNKLGLGNKTIEDSDFFSIIVNHIKSLNFDIVYTNKLQNVKNYGHLPSITIFNEQYKPAGGRIYIYDKYSKKKKRELFMHEVVHIYDIYSPIWSTDKTDLKNGFILSERALKNIEIKTELTALEVMIPIEHMQNNLFINSYDIDTIVFKYRKINTSSVLTWLTINDCFNAHFAIIFFRDNKKENNPIEMFIIDEFCRYKSTPNIYDIIHNINSVAYKCFEKKVPKISGESHINPKIYQCFCYYEKEVQQPLPSSINPYEIIITCDEMVIIGWSKKAFDFIKELQFKKNP